MMHMLVFPYYNQESKPANFAYLHKQAKLTNLALARANKFAREAFARARYYMLVRSLRLFSLAV